MRPLSVVIITFNEAANIGRCIMSVKAIADEIVVLDSYSTDDTALIARQLGAIVYLEKFRGYIGQKNLAMQLASHHYILSLDADEALDSKLVDSINEAKKTFTHRAYRMNRCTNYCGRYIRHGLWYPDKKIRLFDRRLARWGGLNPHDAIELDDSFPVRELEGDLLHYSFHTPEDLVWQNNRLSSIAAAARYTKGRRSNWFRMLVHPAWAFFNGYILRRGFLDGADGFAIAINNAHYVFLKYNKLYRMHAQPKRQVQQPPSPQFERKEKSLACEK